MNIEVLNRINELYHQKKELFSLKCKYKFTLYYDLSRIGEFKCHAYSLKEAKRKLEKWIIDPDCVFKEKEKVKHEFDEAELKFLERCLTEELEKKFHDNYLRGFESEFIEEEEYYD